MTDKYDQETRSRMMRAIKSYGSRLEDRVLRELWKRGFRFRRNVKDLLGKPDIAIKKYKFVLFIDSCFWHGCKEHCRMPESNVEFWSKKIAKNMKRDEEVSNYYLERGWRLLRLWEHDLDNNFNETIAFICQSIWECKRYTIDKVKTDIYTVNSSQSDLSLCAEEVEDLQHISRPIR